MNRRSATNENSRTECGNPREFGATPWRERVKERDRTQNRRRGNGDRAGVGPEPARVYLAFGATGFRGWVSLSITDEGTCFASVVLD
jgi:hypothetical protein